MENTKGLLPAVNETCANDDKDDEAQESPHSKSEFLISFLFFIVQFIPSHHNVKLFQVRPLHPKIELNWKIRTELSRLGLKFERVMKRTTKSWTPISRIVSSHNYIHFIIVQYIPFSHNIIFISDDTTPSKNQAVLETKNSDRSKEASATLLSLSDGPSDEAEQAGELEVSITCSVHRHYSFSIKNH